MTAQVTPRHRISVATAQMRDLATEVADATVWSMEPVEAGATLVELTRLEAQVAELKARVAAHADRVGVGGDVAASSAAAWYAHTSHHTRAAAYGVVRLGHDLDGHPVTRDALAAGEVLVDQARVIIAAVEALPDDLDADLVQRAEAHLVTAAAEHDAKALRILGRRLLEVVAPDLADEHEAKRLEAEERAAARRTWLRLRDDPDGITRGQFAIPTAIAGATLTKALWALAAPKHVRATQGAGTPTYARPTPERLGEAFCELITRYPIKQLPKTGALNATAVVLIDLDVLLGRLERAGVLDTGERISPALARRLACEAGIIPAVLGGASQPLDVGRKRRLHTETMRIAMLIRDRGCAAEECDRTAGLQAHHKTSWANGGTTSVENGVVVCGWHHQRIHDHRYQVTYLPAGKIAFHRRT